MFTRCQYQFEQVSSDDDQMSLKGGAEAKTGGGGGCLGLGDLMSRGNGHMGTRQ